MKKHLLVMACAVILCSCGGSSESQQVEESKTLPSSSLVMKGKHAKLFKPAEDSYKVSLVNTGDGWQVRVKMTIENKTTYEQLKDKDSYEPNLSNVYGELLNSSDVELGTLDLDSEDFSHLIAEEESEQAVLKGHTYSYHHYSYGDAKTIYDKTTAVEIRGIELKKAKKEELKKEESKKVVNSIIEDEDLQDVKEAAETAGKLLEAEKELLKALF